MKYRICRIIRGYDCWGKRDDERQWIPTPDFMTDEQLYEFAMEIQRDKSNDIVELDAIHVNHWKDVTERRRQAEEAEKMERKREAERRRQWDSLPDESKLYVRRKWRDDTESRVVLEDMYGLENIKD